MANSAFGSRGARLGPSTGGLLLYNLCQKRAGQAAARNEEQAFTMTDGFTVLTMISTTAASPTLMHLRLGNQAQHNGLSGGSRFVLRKNTAGAGGDGSILAGDVGWTESLAVSGLRSMVRCTTGNVSGETTAQMNINVDDDATNTAAFNVQFLVLVACRGHRYDPDNDGYPYESSKD